MGASATAELLYPDPMTLEQWADLDEDEPGEFVDGQLEEEEVPTHLHELVVAWLVRILGNFAAPRGGWVFGSEHKLRVTKTRGRKPDVTMYVPGTRLRSGASLSRTPPQLVVEVLSVRPRDVLRDRRDKLFEYARFGVRFYWIIDPRVRLLEVFELDENGGAALRHAVSEGQVETLGIEGLTLDLSALWAEVDKLDEGSDDEDEEHL